MSTDRRLGDRLFYGLCAVCVGLVLADFGYHKHVHFEIEAWPGFDAFYGFAVFVFAVFAGAQLRRLVMRSEDYYAPEREPTPGGLGPEDDAGEGGA